MCCVIMVKCKNDGRIKGYTFGTDVVVEKFSVATF